MLLRPVISATAGENQQALRGHIVTVPPAGDCSNNTLKGALPLALHSTAKSQGGWGGGGAFVHTAMGHSENGIPSEYEKDFLPSVWQSVRRSCILNFRVAFDRKQLYTIEGCERLPLRWKILSLLM